MKEEKKTIKKKKLKPVKILIFSLVLYIICYFFFQIFNGSIKNIYIHANFYLSDQEIIDSAKLEDYPSFILTTKYSIKKNLLKNTLIKNVTIKKSITKRIDIYIKENRPLFYYLITKKTILDNGESTSKKFNIPILNNSMDEEKFNKLIKKMSELNDEIILKISEIEYKPNEIDKERIMLTMTDGNYVYLTLYKFEKINEYNDILPSLEGKLGVLYLDSGNYFEILK